MSSDSFNHLDDLLSELAEAYLVEVRQGNQPDIEELAQGYPELADDIRSVFPMLGVMEDVADHSADTSHSANASRSLGSLSNGAVLGEYRIIGEIGRGGMGVVYEAEHTTLRRRVALKVLPSQVTTPTMKERFHREARAAARLHHTNIVPVFEFGEEQNIPYYAMQCIDGRGLDQLTDWARKQSGDLSSGIISGFWDGLAGDADNDSGRQRWQLIGQIGIQAASALEYAHASGIVHRDIKPSNLLIEKSLHVWVADFGLAKLADDMDLTATGDLVGTLRYLPPESLQGQGNQLGDIYGLGLVLYELVSLQRPFEDTSRLSLIRRITEVGPTPLRNHRRDIPLDLITIIEKSIDRDPQLRYQSAGELANDLQRFVDDKPIKARPHTTFGLAWRWARRNRLAAALISTVATLLVVGFITTGLFAIHLNGVVKQRDDALTTAKRERRTAAEERDTAFQKLFQSHLSEAESVRHSQQMGQRFDALQAIEDAVGLLPRIQPTENMKFRLRSEYIGALAHVDARVVKDYVTEVDRYSFDYNASIDGILVARHRRQVVLIDAADHHEQVISDNAEAPRYPMISPNGRWLKWIAGGRDKPEIVIADRSTGEERVRRRVTSAGYTSSASFDLKDRVVWIEPGGVLVGFDLAAGREFLRREVAETAWVAALSRDGNRVAVAPCNKKHSIKAWDVATGRCLGDVANQRSIKGMSWNHNGTELAATAENDTHVWNLGTGKLRLRLPHLSTVFHLAYSEDGSVLVTSTWGHIARVWDLKQGERLLQLGGTLGWGQIVDQRRTFALHRGAKFELCQIATPAERKVMLDVDDAHPSNSSRGIAIHPDGQLVAVATATGFRLGDAIHGQDIANLHCGYTSSLDFSADGNELIVSNTREVLRWPLSWNEQRNALVKIGPPELIELPAPLNQARFDSLIDASRRHMLLFNRNTVWALNLKTFHLIQLPQDGRHWLVAAGPDLEPLLFNTTDQKLKLIYRHSPELSKSIDFNLNLKHAQVTPDGSLLLVAGDDIVTCFSLPDGNQRYERRDLNIASKFSLNNHSAFLSSRKPAGTLMIETRTGRSVANFPVPSHAEPRDSASQFSPASQRLVSFSRSSEILTWDCQSILRQLTRLNLDWPQDVVETNDVDTVDSSHAIDQCTDPLVDWGDLRPHLMGHLLGRLPHFVPYDMVRLLKHLVEESPEDVLLHVLLAKAQRASDRLDLAIHQLEVALQLDNSHEEAQRLLAEITEEYESTEQ